MLPSYSRRSIGIKGRHFSVLVTKTFHLNITLLHVRQASFFLVISACFHFFSPTHGHIPTPFPFYTLISTLLFSPAFPTTRSSSSKLASHPCCNITHATTQTALSSVADHHYTPNSNKNIFKYHLGFAIVLLPV